MSRTRIALLALPLLLATLSAYPAELHLKPLSAIGQDWNIAGVVSTQPFSYTLPPQAAFVRLYTFGGVARDCITPAVGSTGVVTCASFPYGYETDVYYSLPANTPAGTLLTHTLTSSDGTTTATSTAQPFPALTVEPTYGSNYLAGLPLTYQLTVTNAGPVASGAIYFTDELAYDYDAEYTGASQLSGPAATCNLSLNSVRIYKDVCTIPSLNPGESVKLSFDVKTHPYTAGTLEHDVYYNYYNYTYAKKTFEHIPIGAVGDLVLTSKAPAFVEPNGDLSYTVFMTCKGPSAATNAAFSWTTPPGTTFLSLEKPFPLVPGYGTATAQCNTPAAGTAGTVTCVLPYDDLRPASPSGLIWDGSPSMVNVVIHVRAPGASGSVTNSASGTADHDPDSGNNATAATTTILASPAADLSLTMQASTPSIVRGSGVTFTAKVANAGPSTAQNVRVTVSVPAGMTLSSQPAACTNASPVVCTIASLAAGASSTFDLNFVGTTTGTKVSNGSAASDTAELDGANNTASTSCVVMPHSGDLSIFTISIAPTVIVGQTFPAYVVANNNNGPDSVDGVLTVTLPAELQAVSADAPCVVDGSQITCAMTFNHYDGKTFKITSKALTTGTFKIPASIATTGSDVDPYPANNTAEGTVTVLATAPPPTDADLVTTLTPSYQPLTAGAAATWGATITNNGPAPASSVVLTVGAANGSPATIQTYQASSGLQCQLVPLNNRTVVQCTLPTLAAGASASVTSNFLIGGVARDFVSITASVSSPNPDPNPYNNSISANGTVISPSPDLALVIDPGTVAGTPGQPMTFTIRVLNNGLGALPDVVVQDALPTGLTLVSATPSIGTCNASTPLVCHTGTLAGGAAATIRVTATLSSAGSVTNLVTATGADQTADASVVLSATVPSRRRTARH